MVSGSMVLKMVEEFTWMLLLELFIVVNGKKVKKMVKGTSNYRISSTIMVLLIRVWRKVLELKCLSMAIGTRESTKMVNLTEKANTLGRMGLATKDSSLKEWDRVKAAGNQPKITVISTLVHTSSTKRMATDDMSGPMDVFSKVDSPTTSSILFFT